jgi:hypothetical protein
MNQEQTLQDIRLLVTKMFNEFRDGVDMNVSQQIKTAMQRNESFFKAAALKANEETLVDGKELGLAVVTKRLLEMESKVIGMKHTADPYVLSEKVMQLESRVDGLLARLNKIDQRVEEMRVGKFLDTSITSEELKALYNASKCTHIEVSQFLDVDPSRFYQILNGQEKNIDYKRRQNLKDYFMEKIDAKSRHQV